MMIVNYCQVCGKYIGYHPQEDAICAKCLQEAMIEEVESEEVA